MKKNLRTCQRCGKAIRSSEHPHVIYCSEKCSRPTVEDFMRWKREQAVSA